eukprot:gene19080-25680_t
MLRHSSRFVAACCQQLGPSSAICSPSIATNASTFIPRWTVNALSSSPARYCSSEPGAADAPAPEANEKVKALAEEILSLTVLEASLLTGVLRKKLGVPAPSAMPMMPMMAQAAPAASSAAAPPGKIKCIKEIRAFTNLGLKEAKELVEKAPIVIKALVPKAEAEEMQKKIEAGE